MAPEKSNIGRRNFLQATGAGIVAAGVGATQALAADQLPNSASSPGLLPQPSPEFSKDNDDGRYHGGNPDFVGRDPLLGIVGDGVNSIIEALRKRQDRIKHIGVRHEEAAAFMASGFAKHTGSLASASARRVPAPSIFSTAFTTRKWTDRR